MNLLKEIGGHIPLGQLERSFTVSPIREIGDRSGGQDLRTSLGGDDRVIAAGLTDQSTEFVRDVFKRRLSVGNTGDQGEA